MEINHGTRPLALSEEERGQRGERGCSHPAHRLFQAAALRDLGSAEHQGDEQLPHSSLSTPGSNSTSTFEKMEGKLLWTTHADSS